MVIADKEYPQRVAFALINRVLEEFSSIYSRELWLSTSKELDFPPLKSYIQRFQNPQEADSIMRVQKELDETKDILVTFPNKIDLTQHLLAPNVKHITRERRETR